MQVDFGKATTDEIVKVGDVNVVIKDVWKKPMVFGKLAKTDPRSLCWLMIMKPAAAALRTKTKRSTFSLGGAHRG